MTYRQNVATEYKDVGKPVIVAVREPSSRDEMRISWTQTEKETEPRVDVRYYTVHADGKTTPHRGGLRLTKAEASKLRDALNSLDL